MKPARGLAAALGLPDDALHPTLRRARPLGQVAIDALGKGAGRASYGPRQAGELTARSALTPLDRGTGAWSLNPYVGCLHDCGYCYVPDTMRAQRERWGSYVLVKRNLPTLLRAELRRRPPRKVFLSSATDPYQPAERDHRVTRACLELLLQAGWPVRILTRSPLVLRDLGLLRRFADLEVGLSVPTLDDGARAALEPGAPTIQARLDTLRKLADAGLRTYANYAPAYPLTGGVTPAAIAEAFRAAGVGYVYTQPWGYLEGVLPAIRRRLATPPPGLEELVARVADPHAQARLQATLAVAFGRAGLQVETSRMRPYETEPQDPPS